jgi:hypothetical protein
MGFLMNIEKLTIELTGKPISPHLKVFADGKLIGCLESMKMIVDKDDIAVDIEMIQSKIKEIDGKKETVKEPLVLKWKSSK